MNISSPLFESNQISLGTIDYDADPEIEARWTNDPSFMRMMHPNPMRPLSIFQIKKQYENLDKNVDKEKIQFHFRIRHRKDNRLLGIADLQIGSWTAGTGTISLGIGAAQDRGQGFGTEALSLLTHYAFFELNLYRLTASIPEYNLPAMKFFHKFGFQEEVRRRLALARDGRRWDVCLLGLLAPERRASPREQYHA